MLCSINKLRRRLRKRVHQRYTSGLAYELVEIATRECITVGAVNRFLRRRKALIVHFSGTPKGAGSNFDTSSPKTSAAFWMETLKLA